MARVFRRRGLGAGRGTGRHAGGSNRGFQAAAAPHHCGRQVHPSAGVETGGRLGG